MNARPKKSVTRALFWKEWREQRWLIASLAACAMLFLPMPWLSEAETGWANVIAIVAEVGIPLLSLFLGAAAAASENSDRTIGFLQALPVSTTRPAAAKLALAVLTLWTPIGVLFMAVALWRLTGIVANPDYATEIALTIAAFAVTSLLIWTAAAGVNCSDEVRAGAVGLLVILACWAALSLAMHYVDNDEDLFHRVAPAAPAGVGTLLNDPPLRPSLWSTVLTAAVVHAALVAWFVTRFGRSLPSRPQPADACVQSVGRNWLAPPRRHPLTAIAWKQTRESLPLAGLGAFAILCIAGSLTLLVDRDPLEGRGVVLLRVGAAVWMGTSFCVCIVAGIGLFLDDLRPGLHTFWRSRPMPVDQWFATKFVVGLVMTVLTLAIPIALISAAFVAIYGQDAALMREFGEDAPSSAFLAVVGQAAAFCVAAAAIALTRRAVLAATATILVGMVILVWIESFTVSSENQLTVYLSLLAAAATIIAWLSVRKNWGWERELR
jgi:ABC-type transport system involved in multi-copper enzyme maturation permease subunit